MDILSDKNMIIKVVDAIKREQKKKTSERNKNNLKQLFADDESDSREKIFLALSLIKLPQIPEDGKVSPMTIKSPIPHSFVDKFTNVLLLIRNKKKQGKDPQPTVSEFKNKLRTHDALELISEVMTFSQLFNDYKDFENRRKLAHQYDIVLCDKEIIGRISPCLGKPFYSMKKKPLQVNLDSKDLKKTIEKCLSRSILHLNLSGSCSTVQIGLMNQDSDHIADNILSTIETWKELMPGGWINIRSINLKSETSRSLPLFVSTTLPKDVPKVVNPHCLEDDVLAEDTLTTIDDAVVRVTRFGDVKVLRDQDLGKNKKKAPTVKYNGVTKKKTKNGRIVNGLQKSKQKVFKPRVQKENKRLGGRYFKMGKKSASDGKAQVKVGDGPLKISSKISENQIHKSPEGEITNRKRKRSAQRSTSIVSTERNIKKKKFAQSSTNTGSTKVNLKRKEKKSASKGKGQKKVGDNSRKISNKISKENQIHKSPKGEIKVKRISTQSGSVEVNLKRKKSRRTTGAGSTDKRRSTNE